ncbi:F-box/kelch-repeat protein [Cardamine amara subsp. amara]|uniref:F-box/kelch-repeat protein n=1 Tax=Cardamine amara subsp. amara TaxID=228776 RepID=A0ABD1BPC3_CARAN
MEINTGVKEVRGEETYDYKQSSKEATNHCGRRQRDHTNPLKDEKEVELFYLHYHEAATRPSLICDGLVCIPVPGYVNVLNPSTREFLRFPNPGSNPVRTNRDRSYLHHIVNVYWWDIFPGYWAMGFGKDIVNGSYKVVRMFFDTEQYEILDININWRMAETVESTSSL